MRHPCFSLCVLCALCGSSSAAPPAVTHLYPAGAERGTTVEVTAAGTFDPWPAPVWVSGKGVSVEPAKDRGKFTVTVAKDAVPGTYWLRAHNATGASSLRPFIVGTLPEVAEQEPNDEVKKPQAIDGSTIVVNGRLEKTGDVDCFAVRLKKGQTLVASLEAHHTLRSPMDGMLQVVSADGFVLDESNDFRGLDPQLAYTAKADGTHVVRVFAFPATPDSSIRFFGSDACVYRLTLTTGPFADFALPLAMSVEGKPAVEVRGWNLGPEPPRLSFATGDDGFVTAFSANLANPLRLRAEPHPVLAKATTAIKPPFSATGLIGKAGGEARFIVEATKGKPLTLHAESRSLGLAVNPVVRVLGGDGKQLAKAEPGKLNTDTTLAFTPTADGPVTVEVSDLYAGGGPRHAFLLRVLSEPDYELTVAADRFTAAPGKPATIPVKVIRKNGFTRPVEITAEGLPEGVKLETKPSEKPDPGTVVVTLTAEKPTSGAFRLVGTVGGESGLRRGVRCVLPEFNGSTSELWLTVPPP